MSEILAVEKIVRAWFGGVSSSCVFDGRVGFAGLQSKVCLPSESFPVRQHWGSTPVGDCGLLILL